MVQKEKKKNSKPWRRANTLRPKTKYDKYRKKKIDYSTAKAPKKLGPKEIGRTKYKGTKYKSADDGHFLQARVSKHSRAESFEIRKMNNPVQKGQTVAEFGTPYSWHKPAYFNDEVEKMNAADDWLKEKPMSVRNNRLDLLKDEHLPKGKIILILFICSYLICALYIICKVH